MQIQRNQSLVKRFIDVIKSVWGRIKKALHWILEGIRKRAQTTAPMRRTLDTKRQRRWEKLKMVHPYATLIAMKKRSRAHQDQRMMKRARSTLKS